ncbi:hypothetical protein BN946_scf184766.g36 [Trametes cinnabarina]|uniref:VPS9 domain-containing protein n=1 Tax=Pycnoporus cinnabarinus TaxID=5643 RepID=A0A060S6J8_PYCCI|nr:hypothetical protein BN946_scf184766.g36 [Trametes cinnabarina]
MARRDALFPAGSIGRSGLSIQRNSSHESLTAHPLLSPTPGATPPTSPSPAAATSSTDATPAPRYVPYTPRQRGAPSPATTTTTTGASIHPATPSDRDAANRLQLMNLKAAAQKEGLDTASTGWLILERFALEAERVPEWNELWNAVVDGKATLLLPRDQHPSNVPVTPDFIKDHVAFCDARASSRETSALLSPSTRASAYTALAPLPRPLSPSSTPTTPKPGQQHSHSPRNAPPYPAFAIHAHAASLPLPPRPSAHVKGPPLPPRPGARPAVTAQQSSATAAARLSNPFASLFGRATTASPTPPASPSLTGSLPLPDPSSPSSGLSTSPGNSSAVVAPATEHTTPHNVPAYIIGGRIQRAQVLAGIASALRGELEDALVANGVPAWVREKVAEWSAWLAPVTLSKSGLAIGSKLVSGLGPTASPGRKASDGSVWVIADDVIAGLEGGVNEVARKVQEFWYDLEEEVGKRWAEDAAKKERKKRRWHRQQKNASGSEEESEKDKEDVGESEQSLKGGSTDEERDSPRAIHVNHVMEAVERTVCSLFYDRLFLPPGSDDVSHDEALSSRIAAVNLLDLGLGHLGVEVGRAGREVDALIKACGQTLMQLDSVCRAPADKAAVLVSVHKILVDGLSRLPPLRLKAEDEMADEKTPLANTFNRPKGQDDEHDRAVSPPPTVVVLPDSEALASELQPLSASDNPALLTPDNASGRSDSIRTPSPVLTVSPPPEPASSRPLSPVTAPTPVSGDIILPLMIFAVVKANPPHLVSHLLYTQRFRRERAAGGEEGYCLVNLMAVAEFLENVDLAALGLGESEKTVISTAELSPIPINRAGSESGSPRVPQASLRGRVEQQVDALAGSANKVLTGVVDTSFGVLRALLPGQTSDTGVATPPVDADQSAAPWNIPQPRFGLLRRDTHFSIASIAASLPGRAKSQPEESGQQMIDVPSRPGSIRSMRPEDGTPSEESSEEEEEEDEEEDDEEAEEHDTRSIRSFESMMSERSRRARRRKVTSASARKSLADRLASVPGLSRLSQSAPGDAAPKMSPTGSRRSSLMVPPHGAGGSKHQAESPVSSRAQSPIFIRISPPNQRFLTCTEDDIKVSEVGELLREYKRLAEAVRAMGGFHDE